MSTLPSVQYYEVTPEESQFYTIAVDVTHRCNMNCSNCYSPIRNIPDIDQQGLVSFFQRLGRKTEIRFTGGEPTLREDLPYLIEAAVAAGHRASIMTNALKLADKDYCQKLKDAGLRFVCLSMNGADDDDVYEKLDQSRCAEAKMQALANCVELGFFININCIIAKGINEHVPRKLYEILKKLKVHGVLRFRNIGELGRFMKADNYTFDELIELIARDFEQEPSQLKHYRKVNGYDEEFNVLFPIEQGKKFNTSWIKITDWRPYADFIPDPRSIRRGRVTKDFKVAPFFEHAKLNGY